MISSDIISLALSDDCLVAFYSSSNWVWYRWQVCRHDECNSLFISVVCGFQFLTPNDLVVDVYCSSPVQHLLVHGLVSEWFWWLSRIWDTFQLSIFWNKSHPNKVFWKDLEEVCNDTVIAMIRPVLYFVLEKGNIVGEAMNFGFHNITKTFSNFPHPSWSYYWELFMLSNNFRKKSEKYYNISKNVFPQD